MIKFKRLAIPLVLAALVTACTATDQSEYRPQVEPGVYALAVGD